LENDNIIYFGGGHFHTTIFGISSDETIKIKFIDGSREGQEMYNFPEYY